MRTFGLFVLFVSTDGVRDAVYSFLSSLPNTCTSWADGHSDFTPYGGSDGFISAYLLDYLQDASVQHRFLKGLGSAFRPFIVSTAVNGSVLNVADFEECGNILGTFNVGDPGKDPRKILAIYMSHYYAWKHYAGSESSSPWAHVFEADTHWGPQAPRQLDALRSALEKPELVGGVDIIYTGHCYEHVCPPHNATLPKDLGEGVHAYPSIWPVCAHAYMITRRGAEILLENGNPMPDSVDQYMAGLIDKGKLKGLSICPMLFWQPWIDPNSSMPNHS